MKLYQHQIDALDATKDKNRVAYYLDMGLGKTFVGSEKMLQLGSLKNLVICQKTKISDWLKHFRNNYDHILPVDLTDKKQSIDAFVAAVPALPIVGVINYDVVWRRKVLLNLTDFTLILDESSLIQHDTNHRSKFILKMKPANVILLSGTPIGGKYESLLSQIHLLGWNISEEMFWNHYIDWKWQENAAGYYEKVFCEYKNTDRLKRKLRDNGCYFLKTEQVLDLPDQVNITVDVKTTKAYRDFRKDKIVEMDDITPSVKLIGDCILNQILRERQLCGMYNQNKLESFKELVESTNDRIIVFYNFNEEWHKLGQITDALNRPSCVINGQFKSLDGYEKYNNCVIFIQYQAGAMGLNLQKACRVIYFTPPLSSELFEQSKKRVHRIGQNNTCFYYYMTCNNSIEERIYATLAERHDYTEELFKEDNL